MNPWLTAVFVNLFLGSTLEILDVYSDRLKVLNEVEKLKAKLSKQPDSTKRSKVTFFIDQKNLNLP